jgi:DNA-binding NtrC family response regulator
LLEAASEDCVLLDEIHHMDPLAQGMLLLALQRQGAFRPVGGSKEIRSKFRLIAATNQPLAVLRERLAPDFLDRILDLTIEVPELHECGEDLGSLWDAVVDRACGEFLHHERARAVDARHGGDLTQRFSEHRELLVGRLSKMRLPGNFRDLERLARRLLAVGLSRGRALALQQKDVQEELRRLETEELERSSAQDGASTGLLGHLPSVDQCRAFVRQTMAEERSFDFRRQLREWEKGFLDVALRETGSGPKASQLLGIPVRTFNDRRKRARRSR